MQNCSLNFWFKKKMLSGLQGLQYAPLFFHCLTQKMGLGSSAQQFSFQYVLSQENPAGFNFWKVFN